MNYKLAEQLKEAGFPQDTRHFFGFIEAHKDWELDNGDMSDSVACPTLSELIEACNKVGNRFFCLDFLKGTWGARKYFKHPHCNNHYISMSGKSPEEAVAKLWLKLNKNGTVAE